MKKFLTIILLLSLSASATKFSQYLALTGGTDGVGGRYSYFLGRYFAGKAGVTFDLVSNLKNNEGKLSYFMNSCVTPFIGVYFLTYHGERINGSGGITFSFPAGNGAGEYRDTSNSTDALAFDFEIAPSVEFFWVKDGEPKFSIEIGALKFRPENKELIRIVALCNISIFVKKIGGGSIKKRQS